MISVLHIAICDDEENEIEYLKHAVDDWAKKEDILTNIETYASAESFLFQYEECKNYQILLLDVEMSGMNGIDLAKKIRQNQDNVEIIFITGIWDYVQEGYEVRAYRYIIKPIDFNSFKTQLNLCIKEIENQKRPSIVVTYKGEVNKIDIGSIVYIETDNRNTLIHTKEKSYRSNMGISKIEKHLEGSTFFRCHNSFLINLEYINKFNIIIYKNVTFL